MKDTTIAYLAGLVDGEGYIGIKKSKAYACQGRTTPGYHARIQVRMVIEGAIKLFADVLGGWYYEEKPSVAKGRPLFCYQASDKRAEDIIRILRPFILIKANSCDTVLDLRGLQSDGRMHRTKITGYRDFRHWTGKIVKVPNLSFSDEYVDRCERLYVRCKDLNRVGV